MAEARDQAWIQQLYDRYGPSVFRRARTLFLRTESQAAVLTTLSDRATGGLGVYF
jgi:hypothetical protein